MVTIRMSRLVELEAAEALLKDLEDRRVVREFADAMLHNVGVLLSETPFDAWPEVAKAAFHDAETRLPIGADAYRERLRKG